MSPSNFNISLSEYLNTSFVSPTNPNIFIQNVIVNWFSGIPAEELKVKSITPPSTSVDIAGKVINNFSIFTHSLILK